MWYATYYRRVYKYRLKQDPYHIRMYKTRVGTMVLHIDTFTNVVCSRILTTDAYNKHGYAIWFYTHTRLNLVTATRVSSKSLLQTRVDTHHSLLRAYRRRMFVLSQSRVCNTRLQYLLVHERASVMCFFYILHMEGQMLQKNVLTYIFNSQFYQEKVVRPKQKGHYKGHATKRVPLVLCVRPTVPWSLPACPKAPALST